MPKLKLTTRFVESVKTAERIEYQDETIRGLCLRVSASGVKSWTVRYNRDSDGKKQRVTLGKFPAITLEKARAAALKVLTAIAEGKDPAADKRQHREAMTFQELGDLFIEKYAKPNKKTWAEDQRMLRMEFYPSLGGMKAKSVRKRDILEVLDDKADEGKIGQARNLFACVRRLCSWAVEKDYLEISPCMGIKAHGKPGKRDRVLSNTEIKAIWTALPGAALSEVTKDVIRLLFLTGQRSGEVCGIEGKEVDIENAIWHLPGEKTKNNLPHSVPLSDMALEILDTRMKNSNGEGPLFHTIGKPVEPNAIAQAVRKQLQLFDQRWTPHDIRRTVATGMAEIGIQPHIVEACLNHVSGFKAGVAGIYNRAIYDEEKKHAFSGWATNVRHILG